ncbi:hypothetical protein BV22DRAFT_1198121 [Leucogyrophana mollusca]|uniref:Uncharacterized protein n=1 Tax=Leucogyrophana mollusca TaxID=85980 RepID=A0ACB8B7N5_9AGAM|nr:hypothetical protein BV22DRAFT_1198121 [Leucogyrophana mollusca]
MKRTYSRKASQRRPRAQEEATVDPENTSGSEDILNIGSTTTPRPRKRQKVTVEVVSPISSGTTRKQPTTLPDLDAPSTSATPHTPSKAARDLSALFDTASGSRLQPSTPPKSSGVVRRMLSRSRTESSIDRRTPSPRPSPRRQPSSAALPAAVEKSASLDSLPPSPSKAPQIRHARTYAGTSRSFLIALPAPPALPSASKDIFATNQDQSQEDMEMRESYTDLRTRWGVDNSEDDPRPYEEPSGSRAMQPVVLANGMMNDLKSITELRSKGESRRFLDEVGYLFEGLESSGAIGLRRASALEVVTKLCDPDFSRRAKAADFYGRTWDVLYEARAGGGDKILDSTLAFFAALAARDPHTLTEVAQKPDFVSTLLDILASTDHRKDVLGFALAGADVATLKSRGVLRTEIAALKALGDVISKKSRLVPPSIEVSTRFLISHSLAALPPNFLDVRHIPIVLSSLQSELDLVPPRITAYASAMPLIPPMRSSNPDIPSLDHIENTLRLVDSFLLKQWSGSDTETFPQLPLSNKDAFAGQLISASLAADITIRDSELQSPTAHKCLCVALKILTVLCHDDQAWCKASLRDESTLPLIMHIIIRSQNRWSSCQESTEQPGTERTEPFDLLCLALGLFMNWASALEDVKDLSRRLHIDPKCSSTRLCVRSCQCSDQRSILECLVLVYLQHSDAHEEHTPDNSFLRGYIAVLVGLLVQDSPRNQSLVFAALSGGSLRQKISSLIEHSRTFIELYADLAVQLSTADTSESDELGKESAPVRTRGEDIARGVVACLESLRDKA